MTRASTIFCLMFAFCSACGGCAPKADFLHENFMTTPIGTITVLPVIDARAYIHPDHTFEDITSTITEGIPDSLKALGYTAEFTEDIGSETNLTPETLSNATPSLIQSLGPPDAEWVMVFILTDFQTDAFIYVGATAHMHGYLFNKSAEALWWKHSKNYRLQAGWLLAAFVSVEQGAVEFAYAELLRTLPKRTKIKPVD